MEFERSRVPPGVVLLGLRGFDVVAVAEVAGEVELVVETTKTVTGCPACGVVASAKDRRPYLVRDLLAGGRLVALVWSKRVWACREPRCSQRTWSESSEAIRPRAVLTERARVWAFMEVGRSGRTVAEVARSLGVGWHTVMRAVRELGEPVVDDPARLAKVRGIRVDETAFLLATAVSTTRFVTGIVDITRGRPARLLDVVDGRSGPALAGWLSARDPGWKRQVDFAALDPFRGYANALRTELGEATRVLDAFHTVRLGFAVVDEVRRRVQQQTLPRRGHRNDPLYRIRRVLRRGAEHLTDTGWRRLQAGLDLGDPHGEVAVAWVIAQQLRRLYSADRLETAEGQLDRLLPAMTSCPVPEVARLGRTLTSWRAEILAY